MGATRVTRAASNAWAQGRIENEICEVSSLNLSHTGPHRGSVITA